MLLKYNSLRLYLCVFLNLMNCYLHTASKSKKKIIPFILSCVQYLLCY